ncbi:hypothetical protein BC834DRAFT_850755 [Gloeopeniophorella convolvens]|nr:hypothetical protein BC834DRAFT_850755 [Gloeopeniophorella convolvens]
MTLLSPLLSVPHPRTHSLFHILRSSSSSPSSGSKQPPSQGDAKRSSSRKLSNIATAIGLKPKKSAYPVEEPPSPDLPLHAVDIESPPRHTHSKPVSVAVGWSDPHSIRTPLHDDFADRYPQSVFSSDLDPFAAKYNPDSSSTIPESVRFSTFSDASTTESHLRRDPYAYNRMSFASSSSQSHQRSDFTADTSPASSPLLSPMKPSGRRVSRLTVESEKIRTQAYWEEHSHVVSSPSAHRCWPLGYSVSIDSMVSGATLPSAYPLNGVNGPRVVIRQPSASRLHALQAPGPPPSTRLPSAPDGVHQGEERSSHSAASSSSSLSFASSVSSRLDPLEPEGRRRDVRRLKDSKKSTASQPVSPVKDRSHDVYDVTLSKKSQASVASSGSTAAEDPKLVKKQRSFHHARIPMPPLPASFKHTASSSSVSGRDALSVPEGRKGNGQPQHKSPQNPPVLNPTHVRKRLFSGSSLRRSLSSQTQGPDEDTQSILSLTPETLPRQARPHTSSGPNKSGSSSFWDEDPPLSPGPVNEPQEHAPQPILSPAELSKIENMLRGGENVSEFMRSRGNSFTSVATSKFSVRTAPETHTPAGPTSPPPVMRHLDPTGASASRSGSTRARGASLQARVSDVMNARPHTGTTSPGGPTRSQSFQASSLPPPPRSRGRPSTSNGRRHVARRAPESTAPVVPVVRKSGITRRPSFLEIEDEPPPEDSFLDMGKASLDTFGVA